MLALEAHVRGLELAGGFVEADAGGDRGAGVARGGVAHDLVPFGFLQLRRLVGDVRPVAALDAQHPRLGEPLVGARDGGGVDAQVAGEVAHRRHGRARRERADGDEPPHPFFDLPPDGCGICWFDVEHCWTVLLYQCINTVERSICQAGHGSRVTDGGRHEKHHPSPVTRHLSPVTGPPSPVPRVTIRCPNPSPEDVPCATFPEQRSGCWLYCSPAARWPRRARSPRPSAPPSRSPLIT